MAILQLDTDALRSAVSAAKRASDSITEAMELLNKIVVHHDWICKERETINSYTLKNREQIGTLNENASAYYNAVNNAAARFEEEEQRQIASQANVESILAQIHNVVPNAGAGGISITNFGSVSDAMGN